MDNNDAEWEKLSNDLRIHMKNMNWGLYRNTKFSMAEILRKEKKFENALFYYFEVCYLDINGPNNVESIKNDPSMLKQFPAFNAKMGFLAPAIVSRVKKIIGTLKLSESDSKLLFFKVPEYYRKLVPLSPQKAWEKIVLEIFP